MVCVNHSRVFSGYLVKQGLVNQGVNGLSEIILEPVSLCGGKEFYPKQLAPLNAFVLLFNCGLELKWVKVIYKLQKLPASPIRASPFLYWSKLYE